MKTVNILKKGLTVPNLRYSSIYNIFKYWACSSFALVNLHAYGQIGLSNVSLAPTAPTAIAKPDINIDKKETVNFSAREVFYDAEKNMIEARGRVTAIWKGQTVYADVFRYDTEADKIEAFGNVLLKNAEGYETRTNKIEFSGDFKDAVSDKLTSRLPNGSVISAQKFERKEGRYNRFYNASYAPCADCLKNNNMPLWAINSKKITHDEQKQYITAQNATFDIYGQPVLWVPWFAYPDPTVDRKSGLLSPSFGYEDAYGIYASLPLFLVINKHTDLTLKPFLYEKNNIRLENVYRQQFKGGGIRLGASLINDQDNPSIYNSGKVRWDIDSSLIWQFAPQWHLSSNIRLASDETYLNNFDIEKETDKAGFLRSDFTIERRGYDSWLQLQSLYFQTQTTTINQDYIPTVLPELTFDWISDKDKLGGNAYLSLQSLSLYRSQFLDVTNHSIFSFDSPQTTHRFMSQAGWNKNWIGYLGEEYSFDASLSTLYWMSDEYYNDDIDYSANKALIRPKFQAEISYPVIRKGAKSNIHLEPIAQALWTPEYDEETYIFIPNEDSHIFELTPNNLFSANRFSGYDREEGGLRFNYGLRGSFDLNSGGYSRFTIGQVWRPYYDGEFENFKNSGTNKSFSDIVAQIEASPVSWLSFSSNGRFDQDDFSPRRLDFGGSIGPSSFKFSGYYTWFDDLEDFNTTEELKIGLSSRITDQLRFNGYVINDLQSTNSKPKEAQASLLWENESVAIGGYYKREWNSSSELDSFGIQLNLKTLARFNFDL